MCGICGIAGRDASAPALEERRLRAMTDAIVHRGPDEEGLHLAPGIALGMRRLSIIDVAGSHQPIASEDRGVLAVFNGEIYNFGELRAELEARGHRLATQGDGEVIVHLYEEHGLDFARRLEGIFAIAIWDRARRRLVLVRDQLGVKPLYCALGPDGLAFASEVKSLIAGGLLAPALDPLAAELFLALGFVPGKHSLFAGVEKVLPGSMVVWSQGAPLEQRRWYSPGDGAAERPAGSSWAEDQERLLELLRASTRAQMVSDVPLGSMLSGGLDSSLITALMAEASPRPVKTFSIGFVEDADANELDDARGVAARLGCEHHELLTSATEHPELLDEALWHLEEPIADVSFLGFKLLSSLAARSVTVALSGQGADELLGGYRKHQIAAAAGALGRGPGAARAALALIGRRAAPGSTAARGLAALSAGDPAARLLAMSRVFEAGDRDELLSPGFRQAALEQELHDAISAQLPPGVRGPLGQTLALDMRLALADNMLLYFDKMSMASSLEVRVPFLDTQLVGFCMQLPDSRKVWLGRRKELLKRASRGLVDEAIIGKRKRGFFHSALGAWLQVHRDALLTETLRDPRALARGQYDRRAVGALLAAAGSEGKKHDQRLFCLMLLERWQQLFVDGDWAARRPAAPALAAA